MAGGDDSGIAKDMNAKTGLAQLGNCTAQWIKAVDDLHWLGLLRYDVLDRQTRQPLAAACPVRQWI